MKKLLVLLVAVVFASCSQDQVESVNPIAGTSLSVLVGKMLSYKDDESFIKEYSVLSEMKTSKEIQNWITKKGHESLLNNSNDTIEMQNDLLDNKRIIYSDAIKSILNNESKFKISDKVIWANEQNLYLLDENNSNLNNQELMNHIKDLKIYGNVLNKSSFSKGNANSSLTSRIIIPNENRSKDWIVYYNSAGRDRRIILTLFNETIILNDITTSSKMFIRCIRQGKFCSFWKCSWNEEFEPKQLALNIYNISNEGWVLNPSLYYYSNVTYISSNNNTVLLATALLGVPYAIPSNFSIDATAYVTTLNGSAQIPYNWTQQISWY